MKVAVVRKSMSLRGVENPVAISFGIRNSHNTLTFGVNVFPFHVIPSDPLVAWESSLPVPTKLTANLLGLVFSVPFLLAQKKRHQRKHVRVFCPKIHKHGLSYKPSVCVRSTDTTRRTEVVLC